MEPVVHIAHLQKKFCKDMRWSMWYGMQDLLMTGQAHPDHLRRHEFWALNDINLDIRKGQSIGLVGRNGSGKTTLMRLIAGILPPTSGALVVQGKVTPIFRLRSGMHPHYSGRDYVYIQAAMHGLSRQRIDAQFDEIVAFAELEDFIDAPVGTYSSGMKARLGYSIAMASDFEVLIIDEALAVGDTAFRRKCLHNLKEVAKEKAIIFVSHDMDMVQEVSNTIVVMDRGRIILETHDVSEGIAHYQREVKKTPRFHAIPATGQLPQQPLPNQLELISIHIPKTAGTSFRLALEQVYGNGVARFDIRQGAMALNEQPFTGSQLPHALKAIHGHIKYPDLAKAIDLSAGPKLITWLRNPVDRVVSNYYYLLEQRDRKQKAGEDISHLTAKLGNSLEDFARTDFARNRMSKFLSGLRPQDMFFIGSVDRMEEDVKVLAKRMGWPEVTLPQVNQSGRQQQKVSETMRQLIADLNHEDMVLYHEWLAFQAT